MRVWLAAMVWLGACAPDLGQGAQAIHNGAAAPDLDAVVGLLADGELFCTGTLIAPRVVLTAAHCVDRFINDDTTVIEAFFGARVDQAGTRVRAGDIARQADWRIDALPNDIAVVALLDDGPVAPLPASTTDLTADIDGTEVTLVGFGITTLDGTDSGVRRSGVAQITGLDERRIAINGGPEAGSVCAGDSGGPTLLSGEVIGVHSRASCSTLSLDERVDVHHEDLIDGFVEGHPGGDGGGCDAGGGGAGLSVMVIVGVAGWRRRRARRYR